MAMMKKDWNGAAQEDFRRECYRRYQLDWMMAHGYSVEDLGIAVLHSIDGGPIDENREPDEFMIWEHNTGFGGEIWAGFEEFLDAEYKDKDYMLRLLPEDMHGRWEADHAE